MHVQVTAAKKVLVSKEGNCWVEYIIAYYAIFVSCISYHAIKQIFPFLRTNEKDKKDEIILRNFNMTF